MVLTMERWMGKVAIVTGASSGIGAAVTELLVKEGVKVVALARRVHRLEELARKLQNLKGEVFPLETDMMKEEDILNAFQWTKEHVGPVHILVNNAGLGKNSSVLSSTTEMWNEIFHVNVIGLCIATREAIKEMKNNGIRGHVININSVLGHYIYDIEFANLYPASKHAVTVLTETIRLELRNQNSKIKITSVSPGLVDTEMLAGFRDSDYYKKLIEDEGILKVEDVAEAIIYVLSTPPSVQIHELMIRAVGDTLGK